MNNLELIDRLEGIRQEYCPMLEKPSEEIERALEKYNSPCGCLICMLMEHLIVEELTR